MFGSDEAPSSKSEGSGDDFECPGEEVTSSEDCSEDDKSSESRGEEAIAPEGGSEVDISSAEGLSCEDCRNEEVSSEGRGEEGCDCAVSIEV